MVIWSGQPYMEPRSWCVATSSTGIAARCGVVVLVVQCVLSIVRVYPACLPACLLCPLLYLYGRLRSYASQQVHVQACGRQQICAGACVTISLWMRVRIRGCVVGGRLETKLHTGAISAAWRPVGCSRLPLTLHAWADGTGISPQARYGHSAVVSRDGSFYIFGGDVGEDAGTVGRIKPPDSCSLPCALFSHACLVPHRAPSLLPTCSPSLSSRSFLPDLRC